MWALLLAMGKKIIKFQNAISILYGACYTMFQNAEKTPLIITGTMWVWRDISNRYMKE